jgi:lipopolysaccharide transport system ATP-binding protein
VTEARQPVVSVRDVSKAYKIYERPRDIFLESVMGGVRHDLFWAVKNLSFDVMEGERVGIVGPNGAGKSTLLQMITGNLTPTSGSVTVNGDVSAMLSLNSFLNAEDTGLENIRFSLMINGVDKREIPRLTDEIVDFAELGAFIYAPVRTYSSGMNARLSFSIATVITPDILIIDEVLGAGDAYFSGKAMLRMIELCNAGRALLFVSHSTSAVQLICNRAIWLDAGGVRAMGPVDEIIKAYEDDFRREEDERVRAGNIKRREEMRARIREEEVVGGGVARMRLIGHGGRLGDTHYVRRILVDSNGARSEVSLYVDSLEREGAVGRLDLAHSEWGRAHSRRGFETRVLAPSSRQLRGGHMLVKVDPTVDEPLDLAVTIELTSLGRTEQLELEVADLASGEWRRLPRVSADSIGDGWRRIRFAGELVPLSGDVSTDAIDRLLEEARPDLEIVGVDLFVEDEQTTIVRERQPFVVTVSLDAHRLVACADVWAKIVRADGTYIFWQSTGQVGRNLVDVHGKCEVDFIFDPNLFGAGEYDITIDVGNGYDILHNFPHSEVYDRAVNALRFTVDREWPILNLGPLNHRFPVEVRGAETSPEIPSQALETRA